MLYFLGDVHGNFSHILPAIEADETRDGTPKTVIFLGDLQAQRPFEEEIKPLIDAGIAVWLIHGNHDTDSREEWERLQPSWHRNLHGRVVEIEGLRIAGLGGVFRGEVWHPPQGPQYRSLVALEKTTRGKPLTKPARMQRALKHSSTIFPDDYDRLAGRRADILVTHEAPSCHPHGFKDIDALARKLGVQSTFHGHHHDSLDYRMWDDRLGFRAYGVGFCGITDITGRTVLAGDFDEARRYRAHHPIKEG